MYIVQEIQTTETTALLPPLTYESQAEAESAFYSACASAAISSVLVHTVMMYTEVGATQLIRCFDRREHGDNI